jgi:hypothetical protein
MVGWLKDDYWCIWKDLKGFSRGPIERLTEATATLGQDRQYPTRDLSLASPEHKSTTLLLHQSAQWCGHRVRVCFTEIAVTPLNYQNANCVLSEQMRAVQYAGTPNSRPDISRLLHEAGSLFEKFSSDEEIILCCVKPKLSMTLSKGPTIELYSERGLYFMPWHPSSFKYILILSPFVSMYPKWLFLFIL